MPNNLPSAYLGRVYSHVDAEFTFLGRAVGGFQNAEFSRPNAAAKVYGAGQFPIGWGDGQIDSTFSVDLLAEELQAMQDASPTGFIGDLPPSKAVFSMDNGAGRRISFQMFLKPTNDPGGISDGDIGKYYSMEFLCFGLQRIV